MKFAEVTQDVVIARPQSVRYRKLNLFYLSVLYIVATKKIKKSQVFRKLFFSPPTYYLYSCLLVFPLEHNFCLLLPASVVLCFNFTQELISAVAYSFALVPR